MTPVQTLLILVVIVATASSSALLRRRSDVRAIERALYPEIVFMRFQAGAFAAELARRHASSAPLDAGFFLEWRLSAPLIYPAIGPGLGLLSGGALDRIGYFHAQLADARERAAEFKTADNVHAPYRLLSNVVRAYNHVEPWLKGLEPRFGPLIDRYPDTAAANALLEAFEEAPGEPLALPYCWTDACVADER